MGQNKFKAKIIAPVFTKAPVEEVEKWAKNIIAAADKAYKHSKKSVRTRKDFEQKIAEPAERGFAACIGDINSPINQQMMVNYHANMKRAAKRYFLKHKLAYKTSKYAESIELAKQWYAESWVRYIGPLRGDKKNGIKGLGALGAMVLTADKNLEKFLKKDMPARRSLGVGGDEIILGIPICITPPDKTGKFRNELRNLIVRSGTYIIMGDYQAETIRLVNERLNQIAEKYRLPEIAEFRTNGESYINFIKLEIPNPDKPDENMDWLGLDIQVAIK